MKCPKCDYLGFETGDRCKNCGYDFSLLASPEPEPADLSLTSPARDDVPVGELWLAHSNETPQSSAVLASRCRRRAADQNTFRAARAARGTTFVGPLAFTQWIAGTTRD